MMSKKKFGIAGILGGGSHCFRDSLQQACQYMCRGKRIVG